MKTRPKITPEVAKILKSYVYVYIDPRNGEPFYIGKGKDNRAFTHLSELAETNKVTFITSGFGVAALLF